MSDDFDDRPFDSAPSRNQIKFPALEFIAHLYMGFAVFAFGIGILAFVNALMRSPIDFYLVGGSIVWTFLAPLALWGSDEVIFVFIRIEDNTSRTNDLLRKISTNTFGKTSSLPNPVIKQPPNTSPSSQVKPFKHIGSHNRNEPDDLDIKMEMARRAAKAGENKALSSYFILFYIAGFAVLVVALFVFLGRK